MKIGILDACPPDELNTVSWNDTPVDAYIRFIESVEAPFEYEGYRVAQGEFPESPEACDAYLITGSPRGVYDSQPWITDLERFIQDCYRARIKLVGICFGHQILAHALGGHAEKSEKGWDVGLHSFEINTHKDWMTDMPDQCSLYFVHQDQVMELPPEAELLGGNDFCPNLFYTIDNRALGIQGHPELTRENMVEILEGREEKVGAVVHRNAVNSLENGAPNNQLLAQWVVNFLTTSSEA